MNIFTTVGYKKIPAHKDESLKNGIYELDLKKVKRVYFPLVAGQAATATCAPLVLAGEKVKVGTLIAYREEMSVPLFSSVSGTVIGIEKMINVANNRLVDHLVIENDFKMEHETPLKTVSHEDSREEIVQAIKKAGIVGLGGAGFPTWIKYNNTQNIHTVLINAVECEPYLTTDYCMSKDYAVDIIEGSIYLQKAAEAQNVIIAIKKGKEEARDALINAAINYPSIKIVEVPDKYPMGWEGTLVKQIFKKRYNRLPSEIGVIVNNVMTAISVNDALKHGKVLTKRRITVSGNIVTNPSNIIVPIGVLASVILDEFKLRQDVEFNLLPGGPMTTNASRDANFAIQPIHGGLTLLEKVTYKSVQCLRCGECTNNCPAGLQPVEIMKAFEGRDNTRLDKLETSRCMDCGLCSYVCPSKIEVADFVKKAKTLLRVMPVRK